MDHDIVFIERDTIAPGVELRHPSFPHRWTEYGKTLPEEMEARLAGATIAIVNKLPMREKLLARLPQLKMIAVAATGTDNVDKAYCRAHGIVVSNIRGYAIHTVPEHTFALILALRRGIVGYREDVRRGAWQTAGQFCFFAHPISDLHGSRLGIIGEGAIGQGVATLGRAFGMEVLFAAHKGKTGLGPLYTPWDEVIETADIITLHSPLLPETAGMIALPELRRMKRSAILINAARGGLVVEEDLVTALKQGLIAGAAIDVLSAEPPPPDHPLLAIADLPNFILTPHVAWASQEAIQTLADQLIDCIEAFAAGWPMNVVTGAF